MLRLIKWAMWIDDKSSGKREIAVIVLIITLGLTLWAFTKMDSKGVENIVEWWILAMFALVAGAFGFEQLTQIIQSKVAQSQPQPAPDYGTIPANYPSGLAEPDPLPETPPESSTKPDRIAF